MMILFRINYLNNNVMNKNLIKAIKVDFSKLIGNKYSLDVKMAILDWMLKTGKGHGHQSGWNGEGINRSLLSYSANNYNTPACLPKDKGFNLFFDAIFARAVYAQENKPLKEWRKKESIYPNKYRMLKFNDASPRCEQSSMYWLISDIFDFENKLLKKECHHPDYEDRIEPKILWISIFTTGSGWIVQYGFSFKNFNYENGWANGFYQNENESIFQFIKRSYDELCGITLSENQIEACPYCGSTGTIKNDRKNKLCTFCNKGWQD